MTILVTGATGTVGRHVVARLVAAGRPVRALTRTPETAGLPKGVDVVKGDLNRSGALAFDGVRSVFLIAGIFDPAHAADLAQALVGRAVAAGVARIVTLTSSAVTTGRGGHYDTLHAVEQVVEKCQVAWTHVRPGEFAVNKLDVWGASIRNESMVRNAYPDGIGVPIHEADIADVAAIALTRDGHAGRAYDLTGPEALTHREQAQAIGAGLGRAIAFEGLTYGQARRAYLEAGFPAEIAEFILGYQAEYAEEPPSVSPTFEQVTGKKGRTLAQWAVDHAAELAPAA
ncbi:NAD(P)H-binding protein [Embleya scabrispora]|uniref:NAD(P)H-binding protein n=1 Tax=Embleya scabrispora TaxID=159449 RepID=UPI0003667E52|nr:NAD(P)H-binding protein [Embleya scabrispora]MYS86861.1 NmrA family NAD(P)-binding protein [Streptomyces sp. SID5474]